MIKDKGKDALEEYVEYLGKTIPSKHFRTFIYNSKNEQKLVESWDEFCEHMATGLWFAQKREIEIVGKTDELKPAASQVQNIDAFFKKQKNKGRK